MYGEINLVIKKQDAGSKGFANAQFIYNLNLEHNDKKLRLHLISESKESNNFPSI